MHLLVKTFNAPERQTTVRNIAKFAQSILEKMLGRKEVQSNKFTRNTSLINEGS